ARPRERPPSTAPVHAPPSPALDPRRGRRAARRGGRPARLSRQARPGGERLPPPRPLRPRAAPHKAPETPRRPLLVAVLRLHEGTPPLLPRPGKGPPAVPPDVGAERPHAARVPAGDLRGADLPARRQRPADGDQQAHR